MEWVCCIRIFLLYLLRIKTYLLPVPDVNSLIFDEVS